MTSYNLLRFFYNDPATTEIYTLSLHDALPILPGYLYDPPEQKTNLREEAKTANELGFDAERSEEHTSELQSLRHLVCRLLLEKKKTKHRRPAAYNRAEAARHAELALKQRCTTA